MNPQGVFCANPHCADSGVTDKGNVLVHSHKERRFRCATCNKTFAATTGTPFYRLHKQESLFLCVITLLVHGCPLPAVVAAFGLDERTVASWQRRAGSHCSAVHQHHLETRKLDLKNGKPMTEGRPAALTTLYVSFGLLSGLDYYTTLRGARAGATEGNPLIAPIAGNPAALLAVRAGGSAVAIYFAERLRKRNRAAAIAAMAVTNGVLAAIVAHNARVLGRAGALSR